MSNQPSAGAGASPLADIITQVPQSTANNPAIASGAARPVKVKKKKTTATTSPSAASPDDQTPPPAAVTTVTDTPKKAAATTATTSSQSQSTPRKALSPAEAAAAAAQRTQAQQAALAPPRTTSKQQRKPSTTTTTTPAGQQQPRSTSTSTATGTTPGTAPPAPPAAPPTSRSQAYTTTAPKSSTTPATTTPTPTAATATATAPAPTTTKAAQSSQSAAQKQATTAASPKPKFFKRIIAIITCSSPTHIQHPSEDSGRTLAGSSTTTTNNEKKASYETIEKQDLSEKAKATATATTPANNTALAPVTPVKQKSTVPQTTTQAHTNNTLAVPSSNGRVTPSSSSTTTAAAAAAHPPSPSPSTIAGGTRLPREETGDVLSGAVVPPGASYVGAGAASEGSTPVNMVRRASAVDGVPSLAGALEEAEAVAAGDRTPAGSHTPLRQHPLASGGGGGGGADVSIATAAVAAGAALAANDAKETLDSSSSSSVDADAAAAAILSPQPHDESSQHHESEDDEEMEDDYELSEEALEEQRLIAQGGNGIPVDEDGNPHPLLTPIIEKDAGRKCLVLDLDETLVHSSFKMIQNADFIVPVEIEGHFHNVYVIKRPGVDEFMRKMGEIYEVVIFTASLSKYADPVLDILDIHRVVRHRLFRESCYNHKGNYVKDLSQLGREIGETLILDNSPASYIFNPNNAVPISSWFNDPHDTELVDLCEFLRDLSAVDDVRTVLDGGL